MSIDKPLTEREYWLSETKKLARRRKNKGPVAIPAIAITAMEALAAEIQYLRSQQTSAGNDALETAALWFGTAKCKICGEDGSFQERTVADLLRSLKTPQAI
jgi:hypothetical protein